MAQCIIDKESLSKVFAYIDIVKVCGNTREDHGQYLKLFKEAASMNGLTFNDSKSILRVEETDLLGYRISQRKILPDPEQVAPLYSSLCLKARQIKTRSA